VALDAAPAAGYRLLVSRPTESERTLAYSGLADLLSEVDPAHFEELPTPQRHALNIALVLEEPTGRPPEPRAIYAGLGRVLQELARERPVLVAIDDWQWLDRSSTHAIAFASRRSRVDPIGTLVTSRLPAGGEFDDLSRARVATLGPPRPAAVYQLIESRLGLTLTRSAVLRVHRLSGGNPFYALEVARALVTAGLPHAADPWPVPDDLREMVIARIAHLPGSARS